MHDRSSSLRHSLFVYYFESGNTVPAKNTILESCRLDMAKIMWARSITHLTCCLYVHLHILNESSGLICVQKRRTCCEIGRSVGGISGKFPTNNSTQTRHSQNLLFLPPWFIILIHKSLDRTWKERRLKFRSKQQPMTRSTQRIRLGERK